MGDKRFSSNRRRGGSALLSLAMIICITGPLMAQQSEGDSTPFTIHSFDRSAHSFPRASRNRPAVSQPPDFPQRADVARSAAETVPVLFGHSMGADAVPAISATFAADETPGDNDNLQTLADPNLDSPDSEYSRAFMDRGQSGYVSPFAPNVQYNACVPHGDEPPLCSLTEQFLELLGKPSQHFAHGLEEVLHAEHDEPHTDLNPCPIGIQPIPCRPPLLLEANEDFLGPGFLSQGICTPTGAIWRPALWVFGNFRTGVNYFDNGNGGRVVEWANRLDLFTQLNLSGTERLVLGLRPVDEQENNRRVFTSYEFLDGNVIDGVNADIQTLFFEGDFGEIFPNLDPYDQRALDYGFSVGRQPMLFQQGLLMNEDRIDALTVTKNTLYGNGNLNLRSTFVYAWGDINRTVLNPASPSDSFGNAIDPDTNIVGFFTESDFDTNMVNADMAYTWSSDGSNDMIALGISGVRRIHGYHNTYNSSLHFLASIPTNQETDIAGQGELLFSQFSWTPHHTNDLVYLNSFWAIDQFVSISRGPLGGGPLGQTGLLFSAAGLGRYGAPLSNQASDVIGASLGYQMFFDHTKQQVVFELGARQDTDSVNEAAIAAGMRYQKALNQHWLVVVDSFVAKREDRDVSQGARIEMQMKF